MAPRSTIARRALALALRLYPAGFRGRFGDAMLAAFDEKLRVTREAAGRRAAVGFAVRAVGNAVGQGLAERRLARQARTSTAWRPSLAPEFRFAVRALLKAPGFAVTATIVLALGIGVSTAVFSVLDAVIVRPVPYENADRLATLWAYSEQSQFSMRGFFSSRVVMGWRRQTDLFDAVEASETARFVFEDPSGAELLTGAYVTPGLFGLLGDAPVHGRPFRLGDGRDGAPPVAIVSDRLWRRRLGAALDFAGRSISLDGSRYAVVGVMPATFRFPDGQHDVWLPYDVADPPARATGVRSDIDEVNRELRGSFEPIVLRRSGVAAEMAAERVQARAIGLRVAAGEDATLSARLMPLSRGLEEQTERSLLVLAVAVGFLLLIACANVANLAVARAVSRAPERATRAALGASRGRLIREAVVEHALLAVSGAVAGLWLARAIVTTTVGRLPEEMTRGSMNAIDVDGRAVLFLAAIGFMALVAVAVPAAALSSRAAVIGTTGRHARSATPASRRLRAALVTVEVGLSVVLVTGALLMTRSLMRLNAIDIGLNPDGLIAMRLGLPAGAFDDVLARRAVVARLLDTLRADPAIERAASGELPPRHDTIVFGAFEFADRPGERTERQMVSAFRAWPGYFEAAGIRILEGRGFTGDDPPGAAVVSEGFARKHWPGRSAVGMRFRANDHPWRVIVGVANEVRPRSDRHDEIEFEVYYPHDQVSGVMTGVRPVSRIAEFVTVFVRTGEPGPLAARLPRLVHDVDPLVVVSETIGVERDLAEEIARPRVVFLMMAVFAAGGLVLVAAGLYGVLAHVVTERRREIGVRLALGATPRDVGRDVVRTGLVMVGIGLAAGLAAALALVETMRGLLYEVEPSDPVTTAGVIAVVALTGALAVWHPARRAMRVDPMALLREQ